VEEGCELIGGSCIIAPTGQLVAQAVTASDELISARCDLDMGKSYKETTFNFVRHRQPEYYRLLVAHEQAQGPQ
jgi:hypothetical protein